MKKIKGLKKAVGEYQSIGGGRYSSNYALMYFNANTGELWTNEYIGHGSYTHYESPNIQSIFNSRRERVTMQTVKDYIFENYPEYNPDYRKDDRKC